MYRGKSTDKNIKVGVEVPGREFWGGVISREYWAWNWRNGRGRIKTVRSNR